MKVTNIDELEINKIGHTDAKSKCDKYMHLGMELYGTRTLKDGCVLYDLVKFPDIT